MKRIIVTLLLACLMTSLIYAQAITETTTDVEQPSTVLFTDSCGRVVELPCDITQIAPSGAVATMMIGALAPEYMTNVNSNPSKAQMSYLPSVLSTLPPTGQLYGSKATLNTEQIIATGAQVIVDLGDYKKGIAEDLDALQEQTGIACIFLEADLVHMASAFRALGSILKDKAERAEELALFVEKTLAMAEENSKKVQKDEVVSVMYTSGSDGLGTNAQGSSQAQVIELIGAKNAIIVEKVSSKGGGNQINMEMLYNFNPDIIIFSEGSIFSSVKDDSTWAIVPAIASDSYYEIPCSPYNWMSNPPSMNMVLGIWWLGNLVYPQYYDYDMASVAQEYYKLFFNYDMSAEEANSMLENSIGRK